MQYPVSVILSSPLILDDGDFKSWTISQEEAQRWVEEFQPKVYTQHETLKILGVTIALSRENCDYYDQALSLKANDRLEFGKYYTLEEIKEIGVTFRLIVRT